MYKKPVIEMKDASGEPTGLTAEPEVHKQVADQIKAIGDNVKTQIDELRTSHAALKKTLDENAGKMDSLAEAKVSKLQEDILTRQEALEKGFTKRVDDIEVIARKFANGSQTETKDDEKLFAEAKMFSLHKEIVNGRRPNVSDDKVDVKEYVAYKKAFEQMLRIGKDALRDVNPEAAKYLTVGSDPDGGILVTPAMSARIVQRLFEIGPYRALFGVETIGTESIEMLVDLEEAGTAWESETVATSTTSTPRWNKKRISVHYQSARPKTTQQILDDASINVEAWLSGKVGVRLARAEAQAFVDGDGVTKPRGFLTYDDYTGTKGDGGVNFGQIERTNSGHATQITTDGLINHKFSMTEDYLGTGVYLMNRLTVRDIMKLKDGDGQYIWRPGITEGIPSTLLGLPVRMAKEMPLVTASALAVALADWREAYLIVDRQGITVQRDPFTIKPFVEFYTRRRVGGDVVNFQAIKLLQIGA